MLNAPFWTGAAPDPFIPPDGVWDLAGSLNVDPADFSLDSERSLLRVNSVTQTIADDVATMRFVRIDVPTVTAADVFTVTTAASFYVAGPPAAAGSAVITTPLAVWVDAGVTRLDGNVQLGADVLDANANTILGITETASAVNYFALANAAAAGIPTLSVTGADTDVSLRLFAKGAGAVTVRNAGNSADLFSISSGGNLTASPAVSTSGTPVHFLLTGAAHTTLTSAQARDVYFNLARTVQFAAGSFDTQAAIDVAAPTYAIAGGGGTISDAATFRISGAPSAGTGAILTRAMALWVDAGLSRFDGNVRIGGDVLDDNGAAILGITETASAVNYVVLTNAATGNPAIFGATGSDDNVGLNFQTKGTGSFTFETSAGTDILTLSSVGVAVLTQAASSSTLGTALTLTQGALSAAATPGNLLLLTGAAHSGISNAEATDAYFNFARTVTFTGGSATIASQRAFHIAAPTYNAATAGLTISDAATFYVSGAPSAGSGNVTLTRPYAALFDAGKVRIDGALDVGDTSGSTATGVVTVQYDAIGATQVASVIIQNTTAAADGAQQYSGGLQLTGRGWKTTATAASQQTDFLLVCTPGQSTTAPDPILQFYSRTNVGSWNASGSIMYSAGYGGFFRAAQFQVQYGGLGLFQTSTDAQLGLRGNKAAGSTDAADVRLFSAATRTAGLLLSVENVSTAKLTVGYDGATTLVQTAMNAASTPNPLLTLTTAAHGASTAIAAAEAVDVSINLARTVTFAAGTFAAQRAVKIAAPVYAGTAAGTVITDCATWYVAGPPTTSGVNITLTRPYSAWIDAGPVRIDFTTQATVGAAGGASALPATPTGYFQLYIGETEFVVPYYAKS